MILFVKNTSSEGPGLLGKYFAAKKYEIITAELDRGDVLPDKLDDIEGVIILGGPMNVYEEYKYPYLIDEGIFIKKVLQKEIPFIGICLGAQLLAKTAGAEVTKAPEEEIGFYGIELTLDAQKDPLFRGIDKEIEVFQWHEDTFGIPSGGTLLAGAYTCCNQAFRIGKNAYGLQFHLEANADMIDQWTFEYRKSKDKALREKRKLIIKRYDLIKDVLAKNSEIICKNFEEMLLIK